MEMLEMEGAAPGRPVKVSLWGQASAPVMSALSVHPSRCWNAYSANSGCSRCREACRTNAIGLAPTPSVDPEQCKSCGLCVAVCPTGAFEFPRMYQQGRLRAAAEKLAAIEPHTRGLIVTCPAAGKTQGAQSWNTATPVVCLAALDAGHLVGLAARGAGELLIDASRCSACTVSGGLELVRKLVRRTRALRQSLGLAGKVTLATERGQWSGRAEAGIFLFSEVSYSRREFFAQLRRQGSARAATKEIKPTDVAGGAPTAASTMPESRKLLHRLIGSGGVFSTAPAQPRWLPMRFVEVPRDCRLCESCARNCPGGALALQADVKGVSLSFYPYRCLGCGLCEKICPRGLLKSRPLRGADFPLQRRRVLCERGKIRCTACERPFLATDDSNVCSTCLRLKTLDREMLETLSW